VLFTQRECGCDTGNAGTDNHHLDAGLRSCVY